jgi:hypothetical protein
MHLAMFPAPFFIRVTVANSHTLQCIASASGHVIPQIAKHMRERTGTTIAHQTLRCTIDVASAPTLQHVVPKSPPTRYNSTHQHPEDALDGQAAAAKGVQETPVSEKAAK